MSSPRPGLPSHGFLPYREGHPVTPPTAAFLKEGVEVGRTLRGPARAGGRTVTLPLCPGAPAFQHKLDQGAWVSGFHKISFLKGFGKNRVYEYFTQNKVFLKSLPSICIIS